MRRRAAVEPVIGHLKAEHRLDRNYLKGRDGDRCSAVLAAAGYNFSLPLRWLEQLLIQALLAAQARFKTPRERSSAVLHGRLRRLCQNNHWD
jgi:transposase, IS5 family